MRRTEQENCQLRDISINNNQQLGSYCAASDWQSAW
jgi:hypothetical protein